MKRIGIVDYGSGNIGSLLAVFQSMQIYSEIVREPEKIIEHDLMVLPGVGAAGLAMKQLNDSGMTDALQDRHSSGRPILGICLGAQLMCKVLKEGNCIGFGWIPANVDPIEGFPSYNNGWCRLGFNSLQDAGLGRALKESSTFYFNHRYVMGSDPNRKSVWVEDRPDIPAIYLDDVICAVQFHPEKSQRDGRILLRNIIEDHYGL
jgi:glutamine amidotransferase